MKEDTEHEWKHERNRKSAKQFAEQIARQRRLQAEELYRRYEEERQQLNDAEPLPRID